MYYSPPQNDASAITGDTRTYSTNSSYPSNPPDNGTYSTNLSDYRTKQPYFPTLNTTETETETAQLPTISSQLLPNQSQKTTRVTEVSFV